VVIRFSIITSNDRELHLRIWLYIYHIAEILAWIVFGGLLIKKTSKSGKNCWVNLREAKYDLAKVQSGQDYSLASCTKANGYCTRPKKMTPTFVMLKFRNAFAAQLTPQIEGFFHKSEGFLRESKVSSKEAEGFFRRALGLYTHRFPKRGAASLTDLLGLRLCLPELHLCLPSCVCNGKVERQWKGFRKRASFLKTRTVVVAVSIHSWVHKWAYTVEYVRGIQLQTNDAQLRVTAWEGKVTGASCVVDTLKRNSVRTKSKHLGAWLYLI